MRLGGKPVVFQTPGIRVSCPEVSLPPAFNLLAFRPGLNVLTTHLLLRRCLYSKRLPRLCRKTRHNNKSGVGVEAARKMSQRFEALAALGRDQSSVPSTYM